MMESTRCDGVMVGRAVMGNPFLLSQIDEFLETGSYREISSREIFRSMESLTSMYVDYFGEEPACKMLRGRLSWFVKAMPGCSVFRKKLSSIDSKKAALTLIKEFENSI